jgi:hypothetical protein
MAKTPERTNNKPAPGEAANQEWLGSNVAAKSSPERGAQDRFDLSGVNAILNPTTQPATSGRKPLFRS